MKFNRVKSLIPGLFFLFALFAFVGPATAEAQTRRGAHRPRRVIVYRTYNPFWYRRYDPFWGSSYYPRTAVFDPVADARAQGFKEGKNEGEKDAKKGRPSNSKGYEDYLKATSQTYRQAFAQGYNELYRSQSAQRRDGDGR